MRPRTTMSAHTRALPREAAAGRGSDTDIERSPAGGAPASLSVALRGSSSLARLRVGSDRLEAVQDRLKAVTTNPQAVGVSTNDHDPIPRPPPAGGVGVRADRGPRRVLSAGGEN